VFWINQVWLAMSYTGSEVMKSTLELWSEEVKSMAKSDAVSSVRPPMAIRTPCDDTGIHTNSALARGVTYSGRGRLSPVGFCGFDMSNRIIELTNVFGSSPGVAS